MIIEKLHRNGINQNNDTETIIEFFDLFCGDDNSTIESIDILKTKIKGFLLLMYKLLKT